MLALWLAVCAAMQAQQYVFRAFRQAEGLKNLAINDLAADRRGFLWVATENGVYRFLGSGFERFGPEQGIAEPNVRAVLVAPDGTVWAATLGNLYRWDGHRFEAAGRDPIPLASWNDMVQEDAHHLLIVKGTRLYRLEYDDRSRMVSFLPVFSGSQVRDAPDLAQVSSVSVVDDPAAGVEVWIGCGTKLCSWAERDRGSGVRPPGKVMEWGVEQGLANIPWESVFLDHAGTLWTRGRDRVAVLPRQARRFVDRGIPGTTAGSVYGHGPFIEDRWPRPKMELRGGTEAFGEILERRTACSSPAASSGWSSTRRVTHGLQRAETACSTGLGTKTGRGGTTRRLCPRQMCGRSSHGAIA